MCGVLICVSFSNYHTRSHWHSYEESRGIVAKKVEIWNLNNPRTTFADDNIKLALTRFDYFSSTSWQKITRAYFLVPDVGYCSISSSSSYSYKYAPTDLSPSRLREFLWIGLKSDYFDFLVLVRVIHLIVKLIHLTFLHPTSPPPHGWWLWMFVIFCSYTQNTVSGKI